MAKQQKLCAQSASPCLSDTWLVWKLIMGEVSEWRHTQKPFIKMISEQEVAPGWKSNCASELDLYLIANPHTVITP